MHANPTACLADILKTSEADILVEWMALQKAADTYRSDLINDAELRENSRQLLSLIVNALAEGDAAGGSIEVIEVVSAADKAAAKKGSTRKAKGQQRTTSEA